MERRARRVWHLVDSRLVALPTMAGAAGDVGGDTWSGGERTCMVARAKHPATDERGGGQGGGSLIHAIMGHRTHFQSQCVPHPYSAEAEDEGDGGEGVDALTC